jgi:hypothetical protein
VKERNKKRRKTAVIINIKNPLVRNILLPLPQLISFLINNFQCCKCRSVAAVPVIEVETETFGFATELNYRCQYGHHSSIRPDLLDSSKEKLDKLEKKMKPGEALSSKINSTDCELNRRVVLGLQMSGNERKEGYILSGIMNLNCNPMRNQWTEMQEHMGKLILEIAQEVLEENLQIKMGLSPPFKEDRKALSVARDARWDKRGSG